VFQDAGGAAIRTQDNVSAIPTSSNNVDVIGVAGQPITAGQVVYLADGSVGGTVAGQWYKADSASTATSVFPQIGIALANVAAGSSVSIRQQGQATGLSSLVVGSTYYVGTAGALTATAPANRRVVGVADTTTSLVVGDNAFSDYVEGSWTPRLTFGGASVGMTYSVQSGSYIKIGRLVHVTGRIQLTSKGVSTGIAGIDGLPFVGAGSGTSIYYSGHFIVYWANLSIAVGYLFAILQPGGTIAYLFTPPPPSNVSSPPTSDALFANNTDLLFSGTFQATVY
jgi:hypothetical protein